MGQGVVKAGGREVDGVKRGSEVGYGARGGEGWGHGDTW